MVIYGLIQGFIARQRAIWPDKEPGIVTIWPDIVLYGIARQRDHIAGIGTVWLGIVLYDMGRQKNCMAGHSAKWIERI